VKKNLPDFTPAVKRIFALGNNIRKLRKGFPFSQSDNRAERDREFVKKWREIEKKSSS
jgi:hypothetical protein